MVEAVLAVLIVAFLFWGLFRLSWMLLEKEMLQHAAMRVGRARSVGCNRFQCLKAARVAVLPVAGERLWPTADDPRAEEMSETALARMYMRTPDSSYADGLLRYENWKRLEIKPGGRISTVKMTDEWFALKGEAAVDDFPVYLNDEGL